MRQCSAFQNWVLTMAVLITVCGSASTWAGDRWSQGASDETWGRINRLQSLGQPTRVRSAFVTTCIEGSYAVERAAAVCWIARTSCVAHVDDLEKRLTDELPEIRR